MQCLAILRRLLPHSSDSACSLDEFWEEVESLHILSFYLTCRSICDALDFLIVARIGIPPCDSDVEVEDLLEQRLNASSDLLGDEGRYFLFENLLELPHIVCVEQVQSLMYLL